MMIHSKVPVALILVALAALIGCGNPVSSDSSNADPKKNPGSTDPEGNDPGATNPFPSFVFQKYVIDPKSNPTVPAELYHNPTGEYDFPSILDTESVPGLRGNARGRYFLYYSPHNDVGGINVAFADGPEGPWTAYEGNPVIPREILPAAQVHNGTTYTYDAGSSSSGIEHASTGHPIWNEEENKLFMYFHGYCNRSTNFATSDDGLNFTYGGMALGDRDLDIDGDGDGVAETRQIDECSYARVYRYRIPGKTNTYVMMFMGATVANADADKARNIYLAWSDDGRTWTPKKEPFIHHSQVTSGDFTNLSAPCLVELDGTYFISVQASAGVSNAKVDAHLFEAAKNFSKVYYRGVSFESSAMGTAPDYGRIGSRSFLKVGAAWYMFYEAGQRGSTRIAVARSYTQAQLNEITTLVLENGASTVTRGQGESFALSVALKRLNGEVLADPAGAVATYRSDDPAVVSVLDGRLFAIGTGTATVAVDVSYQGKTLSGTILVEVIEGIPWAFVDDRFQLDYTSYWSVSQGSAAAAVNVISQDTVDGYVRMEKNSTANYTYRYLTRTFTAQTEPGVTFETRARIDPSVDTTGAEFTVRANNRQYKLYLDWISASETGHVKDALSGAANSLVLDTRLYHVYRVIVSADGMSYDIYVDGSKALTCGYKDGTGGNIVKLGFDTASRGAMDIDYFKLKWGIELP